MKCRHCALVVRIVVTGFRNWARGFENRSGDEHPPRRGETRVSLGLPFHWLFLARQERWLVIVMMIGARSRYADTDCGLR